MLFTEAFRQLGYPVVQPRQDWSASNDKGVCLSLWRSELSHDKGRLWMDTRVHAGPHDLWAAKRGNKVRIDHLRKAMREFDGYIDVVIVHGTPGERYGNAEPWMTEQRRGHRWRVTSFDDSTGHFRAEVVPPVPPRRSQETRQTDS